MRPDEGSATACHGAGGSAAAGAGAAAVGVVAVAAVDAVAAEVAAIAPGATLRLRATAHLVGGWVWCVCGKQ